MDGVEGLAAAMYAASDSPLTWDETGAPEHRQYRTLARAVLRALAPTLDPLLAACGRCGGSGTCEREVRQAARSYGGPPIEGAVPAAFGPCPACGPLRRLMAEAAGER